MASHPSTLTDPPNEAAISTAQSERKLLEPFEEKQTSPTSQRYLGIQDSIPRHGSIAGIGVGVTSPTQSRKKRLDPSDPSTWTSPASTTTQSPRPRAVSSTERPPPPRIEVDARTNTVESASEYVGFRSPTRAREGSGSMAAALSGQLDSLRIGSRSPTSTKATPSKDEVDLKNSKESPVLHPSAQHLSPENPNQAGSARRFSDISVMTDDTDGEHIGRIERDPDDDYDEAVEDSDDDVRSSSDEGSPVAERGRKRKTKDEPESPEQPRNKKEVITPDSPAIPTIVTQEPIPDKEPPTPMTSSGKFSEAKSDTIHPHSNFDRRAPSPAVSAGDEDAEYRKARGLHLRISPVDDKIRDRHVKMIIRGEWDSFQDHEETSQEYRHEPRLYLACSDLSNEASYVLEWTVGTLLKDGDTLLIMSAMGDENASKQKENEEPSLEVSLESKKAAEEANRTMDSLTRQTSHQARSPDVRPVKSGIPSVQSIDARSLSRAGRSASRREDERLKAVEKLENDFLKYVRKTSLQVRCMIEVIHCRSPRHLILNAIDELEPTLVVVGTRGQGTVKNVMMGSFSNYLVTKSSVPVMVARKRLKKARHAKVNSQQIRMTNNLNPFSLSRKKGGLAGARID